MHPQVALLVKVELQKLLDVGFIIPIDYLEWVSNILPIEKVDGRIKICTNFRDNNKSCLKDEYLLLNIYSIIDLTIKHRILSLMNRFFGYKKIKIAP